MSSVVSGFEYDIFISYRHNDNRSGWVTDFVNALQEELAATIKYPITIYFDKNPYDGLLETHNVDKSLEGKLKCLIFIPIISQTYCDTKSFAWQHEFCVFNKLAQTDQFGRDIRVLGGNVASRILPVKVHDLDLRDKSAIENEIGGALRAIEFIFKSTGVNRPLTASDNPDKNQNSFFYRDQINKVANGIKEILIALTEVDKASPDDLRPAAQVSSQARTKLSYKRILLVIVTALCFVVVAGYLQLNFVETLRLSNQEQRPIHNILLPIFILGVALFVARMPARRMGFTLLQISTITVFLSGLFNLVVTLTSTSLPEAHMVYLGLTPQQLPVGLVSIEFALIRTLGTSMMAAAIGAWLLLQGPIKNGSKHAMIGLVLIITLVEGDNTISLYTIGMLFYLYTALVVIMTWIGAVIWWKSSN